MQLLMVSVSFYLVPFSCQNLDQGLEPHTIIYMTDKDTENIFRNKMRYIEKRQEEATRLLFCTTLHIKTVYSVAALKNRI